jgi:hypothetical protein
MNCPQQKGTIVCVVNSIEISRWLFVQSRKCYFLHREILMLRIATLLIVLSVCVIAWAGDCPPPSPISLHSDEVFDLQVFFDNTPAVATPVAGISRRQAAEFFDRRPK